ncbi:MAG: ABC transporter permease [Dehalobacterium sp.]
MMTAKNLFYQRLISEWKCNFEVWRTVIDWTVALYLVIPSLAYAGYQYLEWWKYTPPWLDLLPLSVFLEASLVFAWFGAMRLFLQEADQVFLWNKNHWVYTIMRKGIAYSIFSKLITSIAFFLLLAPLLIKHYQLGIDDYIVLILLTFLVKVVLGLVKQLLSLFFHGLKQWFILRGFFILSSFLFVTCIPYILPNYAFYLPCILILFLIIHLLIKKRLDLKGNFLADMEREHREKLKYVRFLLALSGIPIKNPKKQKKRPWLFRNSNLIFNQRTPVNGLVEFGIKATLRNKQRIKQYISFVVICIIAVIGFSSYKWLIWLLLAFIFTNFVSVDWRESMESDFIKLFNWKKEDKHFATRKYLFLMSLPGLMFVSVAMGFQTFLWIGAIAVLPVSVGVAFLMSNIVSLYVYV